MVIHNRYYKDWFPFLFLFFLYRERLFANYIPIVCAKVIKIDDNQKRFGKKFC